MSFKLNDRIISKIFGLILVLLAGFIYGYFTHSKKLFPYSLIKEARDGLKHVTEPSTAWCYIETDETQLVKKSTDYVSEALTLLTMVDKDNQLAAKIIDTHGEVVHNWIIDWFELWPDATHLPEERAPNTPPGTHIHGAVLMKNGDLVFNFEQLGLVRLNLCGEVVWKLPFTTHHSVHLDNEENLWVCGGKVHRDIGQGVEHLPFYIEELVVKVSPVGKILKTISIQEVLKQNDLHGLLHMSILMGNEQATTGDILHNNDVEPFPSDIDPGYFQPGDVMVSLRNINTIMVFNEHDLTVKAVSVGEVVKQHDPDFLDDSTISIFDNNMRESMISKPQSRIRIKSFVGKEEITTYYESHMDYSFYTPQLGKHQWLPNGNVLITSPMEAKAFEIDSTKNVVWEYTNLLGNGYKGLMEEAQRLPESFTVEFFEHALTLCGNDGP